MDTSTQYRGNLSDDVVIVYKTGLIGLQKQAAISQQLKLLLQGKEKELLKQSNQIRLLEQHIEELREQNISNNGNKPATIDVDSGICSTKSFSKYSLQSLSSCVVEDGDGVLIPRSPHTNVTAHTKVDTNRGFQISGEDAGDIEQTRRSEQKHLNSDKSQCDRKNDGKLNSMAEFWAFSSCTPEQKITSVVKELKKTKQLLSETLQKNNASLQEAMISTNFKEAVKSLELENKMLKSQIEELQLFKNMVRKEQEGVSVLSSVDSSKNQCSKSGSFDQQNRPASEDLSFEIQTSTYEQKGETQNNEQYRLNNDHDGQKNVQRHVPTNVTPEVNHLQKEKHLQDEINGLKVKCQKLIQENQELSKHNKDLQSNYEDLLLTNEKMEQQHATELQKLEDYNKDLLPYIEKYRNDLETEKEKVKKLEEELKLEKEKRKQLLLAKSNDGNKRLEELTSQLPQSKFTTSQLSQFKFTTSDLTAATNSSYHTHQRHSEYPSASMTTTADEHGCPTVGQDNQNFTCERCYAEFSNDEEPQYLEHLEKCLD